MAHQPYGGAPLCPHGGPAAYRHDVGLGRPGTAARAAAFAEGTAEPWLERYRGCATVGSPAQQAVERAVLAEVGWPLLGSYRRASDAGDGVVRLEAEPGGVWEAEVREGRRVAQPDCRTSPELATKQSTEWVVEGLRQVVPA